MRYLLSGLCALSLLGTGCTLSPQYVRPEIPTPASWPADAAAEETTPDAVAPPEVAWSTFIADARLRSLIDTALANNRDLRIAALNVERARALYGIQRSGLFPNVAASASGERFPIGLGSLADNGEDAVVTLAQYTVGLGVASWELDFFGRIRSLKDSALNQYFATEQARSAAELSLAAAVAQSYLALAAGRESLQLAYETLSTQQATLELIRQTWELGFATDLELQQARSQVEAARAEVARLTGRVAQDRNALALLVGAPVPDEGLPGALTPITAMEEIPAGLPSEVLLRRPDILAAEFRLRAANANIGAARAAFFPRISLTGFTGTVSDSLSGLFDAGTGFWSFSANAGVPIFTGGALRSNLEAVRVEREISVAQYEKAIQTAFAEVSDALALRAALKEQEAAQRDLVHALARTHELSELRHEAGVDSYLSVLVAQRSLYVARQVLVGVRFAEQANRVTLFKVLGGGVTARGTAP
jgi:outer membrane protein, multidrug efflux system